MNKAMTKDLYFFHVLADEYGCAFDLLYATQIKAGPMTSFNKRLDEISHTSRK